MALDHSNSSNLEQLALKGLSASCRHHAATTRNKDGRQIGNAITTGTTSEV